MNPNLLELTQNYFLGSTVHQVSTAFGEREDHISAALRSVIPLVLGGLLAHSQEPGQASELTTWAQQVHNRSLLTDLSSLLSGLSTLPTAFPIASSLPSRSADMLHSLLEANYLPAVAGISQQAYMQATAVSNLMSVVVSVALGLLGRHIAQHNLQVDGLRNYLGSQRDSIQGALATLPIDLGRGVAGLATGAPAAKVEPVLPAPPPSLVGIKAAEASPRSALPATAINTTAATVQPAGRMPPPRLAVHTAVRQVAPPLAVTRRWPWFLLLALGLAVLGYVLLGRRPQLVVNEQVTTPAAITRLVSPPARVAAPTGHYEATTGTYRYDPGVSTMLPLPTGINLTAGSHSAETQLWQLLTDSTQSLTADKTLSGISLDGIYFDAGKATLTAGSQAQLANLAALLVAFPRATFKFGGFTDNQGPAEANLLLSADRANAVRNTLLAKGIDPARVAAQGYGQTHPVASNATPAGQAQNRRVAVLLTRK